MKRLLFLILFIVLCSFTQDEDKTDTIFSASASPIVVCTTSPIQPTSESAGAEMSMFFSSILDTSWWPARWQCGVWSSFHGWLYISSDVIIALSYFFIPVILLFFIYKRKQHSEFRMVLVLFISFILACGLTHLIDASMFWWPAYRLNALIRFATAAISMGTVFALVKITPHLLQLKSPDELEKTVNEQTEELRRNMLLISAYQKALDEASIVAITDQHGMIKHVNENFCKISKYSKEELIGKDHRIINSGHHSKETIRKLWKTITVGKIWKGELKNKAKDGTIYWVDTTIVPFLNEEGKPFQYMAIRSDITERKQAEENLQRSLKEVSDYKHALDKSAIVAITDQRGMIKHVNDNFCKISKYSEPELIGKDHRIINSGYHSKEFIRELWTTIANGKIWKGELQNRAKDGATYWVDTTIVPFLNDSGKPYQYIAIRADITDRKEAETEILKLNSDLDRKVMERTAELNHSKNQLSENLERISFLATIANNIHDPIITSDNDFMITTWNHYAQELLGWKSEEVIGKSVVDILKPTYSNQTREEVLASFSDNGYWRGEISYQTKQGGTVNVISTASNLKDGDGYITGNLILIRDITERIVAEKKMKEFEYFFNNSNDLSCIANKEGYFEILNSSFEKTLGYSKNEFSKNPFLDFVHPDDIPSTLQVYDQLKSGATVIHFSNRYRKKDGDYLWFDWIATPSPRTNKLYCIARDFTDRKKAEDALQKLNEELEQKVIERTNEIYKNEKRFRALIENNYDVISLMDQSFKPIYRSPSAFRITGWKDEELENSSLIQNIHPDDVEYSKGIIKLLMSNPGKSISTLFRMQHRNGHYLWIEGSVVNLLNEETIKAIVFNFRDVTERKQVEEKLASERALLRTLIDNLPDYIYVKDLQSRHLINNKSNVELLGASSEKETLGKSVYDFLQPTISSKYIENDQLVFQTGKPIVNQEETIVSSSKEVKHLLTTKVPIRDEHNTVIGLVGISRDITWQKAAEEKILRSEKRFKGLIENNKDLILLIDKDFKPMYSSPNLERITGWTENEVNEGIIAIVHSEDRDKVLSTLKETVANPDKVIAYTYRCRHKKGHYIWLEGVAINKLHDESIRGIITNARDVTESKLAEERISRLNKELIASEGKFRGLIENSQHLISMFNEKKEAVYRSPSHYKIIGWTPEEFKKMHGKILQFEVVHPEDRVVVHNAIDEATKKPGIPLPLNYRVQHKDGHSISLEGTITNLFHDESIKCIITNLHDVTLQKEAELKVRESEKIYRTVASSMPGTVVFLLDAEYRFTLVEGDLTAKLGYTKEKLLGHRAIDVLSPDRYQEMLPSFIRVFQGESFIHYFNRGDYHIADKFVPFKNERNEIYSAMVVVTDITEIKRAEQILTGLNIELEQKVNERTAQLEIANKELESFSYSISHDLRAPLRAINGYAKMLGEDYEALLDENGKRLIRIVTENAKRMGQLIDDLLSFSRLGRKEIQKGPINMNNLVGEVVEEIKILYPLVEIKVGSLHSILGDAALIKQVLFNYVSNAAKYSAKSEKPFTTIQSVLTDTEVTYSISDNGAGFDMNYAHKLFQVFQRLHSQEEFEGTGVGLAIVDRIIKKHGGKTWAEGEIDKGATFYFSLPITHNLLTNTN